MDAKKMGLFIAGRRKEKCMTQAELAAKLFLSDKTISKWERGAGLPDIGNLEALADALDVSLLELMQGERSDEGSISAQTAEQLLADTLSISARKSDTVLRVISVGFITVSAIFAAQLLVLFIQEGSNLLFPVLSLVLGLAALSIPVWCFTFGKTRRAAPCVLASMGLAGAAISAQFFDIYQNISSGDWAAVDDTIYGLCIVVLAFLTLSILLNALVLAINKRRI